MTIREECEIKGIKGCWLYDHECPCLSAICAVSLPDEGCYLYRWFRKLIKEDEERDS